MCFFWRTKFAFIYTNKQIQFLLCFIKNVNFTIAVAKVTARKSVTDIYSLSDERERSKNKNGKNIK